MDIVYQAGNRQEYVDQGQSLNIIVHPDMPIKDINKAIHNSMENGLEISLLSTQYECSSKFKQKKECVSCEA